MSYIYKLNSIEFNDGEENHTKINHVKNITVFVGPNNTGKTTALKEILNYVTGIKNQAKVVTKEINQASPNNIDDILTSYNLKISQYSNTSNYTIQSIEPIPLNSSNGKLFNSKSQITVDKFNEYLGNALVTYINTEDRLKLVLRQKNISADRLHRPAQSVFELFDENNEKFTIVQKYFKRLFNENVELFSGNSGSLYYKLKTDNVSRNFYNMSLVEKREYDDSTPNLDDQGDGMKSALGILSAILASNKPIILIDEPEAFLHPPQAYEIGKIIGEISNENKDKQIFISTHSSDFLRGLLDSSPEMDVVYLNRNDERKLVVNLIPNDLLQRVSNDPFLSSINLLEGFFYNGTIVVEGESDRIFYSRAFGETYPLNQVCCLTLDGKDSFSEVADFYRNAHVPFALISDIDIFCDFRKGDFAKLISKLSGKDIADQTIVSLENQRNSIMNDIFTANDKNKIDLRKIDTNLDYISILINNGIFDDECIDSIKKNVSELYIILEPVRKEYDDFRSKGFGSKLDKTHLDSLHNLVSSCNGFGLFPNPKGQLESWYEVKNEDGNIVKKKQLWIKYALNNLSSQLNDNDDLKSYIKSIGDYLNFITPKKDNKKTHDS